MNEQQFSPKAVQALELSGFHAEARGTTQVDVRHLMLGVLDVEDTEVRTLIEMLGVDIEAFIARIEGAIEASGGGWMSQFTQEDADEALIDIAAAGIDLADLNPDGRYGPSALTNLALAATFASLRGDVITTVDVLHAGLAHPDILPVLEGGEEFGLDLEVAFDHLAAHLNGELDGLFGAAARDNQQTLRKSDVAEFGRDLTALARNGELDPVVGRDAETERAMQVMLRRTKSNPVLVGEPGVGKTAIVEGIANRIAAGDAPEDLADTRIIELDLAGMMAGSRHRGDMEEKVQALIEAACDEGVVLFIDEIHSLVGAGAGKDGSGVSVSDMLKPAMARGDLSVVGATTLDEYVAIEKDAALERRFQKVLVTEPTAPVAEAMLAKVVEALTDHHGVSYTADAISAAVRLTTRYIPERNLPDKAIDVLDEAGACWAIASMRNEDVADAIGATEVAAIVEASAGVPVLAADEDERQRLLDMEGLLGSRVFGQDDALSVLSRAVRRSRAGLGDPQRPNGSFIFSGPTGVGKTEAAKALAEFLYGSEDALITVDMSEYMEEQSTAKMIGAPPGYRGHGEPGQLTEAVRRNPWSVVLLDEIEKAHPEVFDMLLQVLEEGRLTDAAGRVVDFSNALIIMTTNLGVSQISQGGFGFDSSSPDTGYAHMQNTLNDALKKHFRPEFLNRVDEVVVFNQLGTDQIKSIAGKFCAGLGERVAEMGTTLHVSDKALTHLATVGFDIDYGARPLRRAVQALLENAIADLFLAGDLPVGSVAVVDEVDGDLAIEVKSL
ncbi:MAG: ATP-dependent Clp protease ATP-binding subunit [Actinomycetia bacterium]|nr:ATP-dependent Clp protease ATP-binding subunit [Actinomycetes bacterium]MCP4845248.1 ATP-dependent Clp protease ATP-binding subunit [Actinomycetes bacterium]